MRTKSISRIALASVLLGCWAATPAAVSAATIANYVMSDQTPPPGSANYNPSDPNTAAPVVGLTVSDLTATSNGTLGFQTNSTSTLLQTDSEDNVVWFGRGSTLPNTIDTAVYAEFTLTPSVLPFNLDELTLRMGVSRNLGGGTTDMDWTATVRSSLDSFASDVGTLTHGGGLPSTAGSNVQTPLWVIRTLDLSGLGELSGPVTFRLFPTDISGVADKFAILDRMTLTGAVVPEPGAAGALLAVAGMSALRRRRRAH